MSFNLRSGNTSSFKSMGSSPLKDEDNKVVKEEKTTDAQHDATDKKETIQTRRMEQTLVPLERTNVLDNIDNNEDDFIGPKEIPPHFEGEDQWEEELEAEDYVVNKNEDLQDKPYSPGLNEGKLHLWEHKVDEYLDKPMDKGSKTAAALADEIQAENAVVPFKPGHQPGAEEVNIDPLRHTLASMYTTEKVGMIPANILGIMHELTAKNTPKEHREDLMNNLIGSVVGKVPFMSTKKKEQLIKKLYQKGYLFSGQDKKDPRGLPVFNELDPDVKFGDNNKDQ